MDSYSIFAILLLAFGLSLLVAEIFIPSGGMILVIAIVTFAASIWCGWNAWWKPGQFGLWWTYIGFVVVLLPTVIGGTFYLLPRTEFGKNLLMVPPTADEVSPYSEADEHLAEMVGRLGTTITLMNPGGLVLVDGERMHCETEGMMIEAGESVCVVAVKSNRLVIRQAPPEEETVETAFREDADETQSPPLDFDVPQS